MRTKKNKDNQRHTRILEHLPVVHQVARKVIRRAPAGMELDDLVSVGTLGLIDAVDRFDATRGDSFPAYLRLRVQGAMLDEIRKFDWTPRSVRDRGELLRDAREALRRLLGRPPTEAEVAERLGVSQERLHELRAGSVTVATVSFDGDESGDGALREVLPAETPDPHGALEREQRRARLRDAVSTLSSREQALVELYYFRDQTFREIAATFGVTESRISQMHTALCGRLPELLEEDEAA